MKEKRIDIDFFKMTGAGNDFILIDNQAKKYNVNWVKICPMLCDRKFGIGADGLIVLEQSRIADIKMLYYNADGSSGGMCGNGGRCVATYVMNLKKLKSMTLESLDFIYRAEQRGTNISLFMKEPQSLRTGIIADVAGEKLKISFVDTGAPHVIVFIDELPTHIRGSLEINGLREIGRAIRYLTDLFPNGTNVDFIETANSHRLSMRTYERGVEDETLACGTGAVASGIIASYLRNLVPPIKVQTRGGDLLIVSFNLKGGRYTNVELQGPAKRVFTGQVRIDI